MTLPVRYDQRLREFHGQRRYLSIAVSDCLAKFELIILELRAQLLHFSYKLFLFLALFSNLATNNNISRLSTCYKKVNNYF